ncbi:HTH_Tnp_Tc3_2 domain-containing protein [Trichonephila clavipes]|nr:HTH_Tnp_Tc3_2 domain-containing protein [Trichonephila clavipes]
MASRKRMEDSERWRAVGRIEAGQSIIDVAFRRSLFCNFTFTETIPNHTGSCPKARRWSPKGYILHGRSIYCYCSQEESQRATSTRVTCMVIVSIGKTISAATVRRRLHMNGLYARVPRVCVPLSVQSSRAR